jgi:hypothetical protein
MPQQEKEEGEILFPVWHIMVSIKNVRALSLAETSLTETEYRSFQ